MLWRHAHPQLGARDGTALLNQIGDGLTAQPVRDVWRRRRSCRCRGCGYWGREGDCLRGQTQNCFIIGFATCSSHARLLAEQSAAISMLCCICSIVAADAALKNLRDCSAAADAETAPKSSIDVNEGALYRSRIMSHTTNLTQMIIEQSWIRLCSANKRTQEQSTCMQGLSSNVFCLAAAAAQCARLLCNGCRRK